MLLASRNYFLHKKIYMAQCRLRLKVNMTLNKSIKKIFKKYLFIFFMYITSKKLSNFYFIFKTYIYIYKPWIITQVNHAL